MSTRLPTMLMVYLPVSFMPVGVLADSCGDYPFTDKQIMYLAREGVEIVIPEGEVPVIQRCDADGNGTINNDDLFMIRAHRGELASHPDDPMDWDGNGVIHGRDVGGCASACNSIGKGGCAVKDDDAEEEAGVLAAEALTVMESVSNPAACYQTDDIDGDGTDDFVGLLEYTGTKTRGGDWTLDTIILTEDGGGNVTHVTYPYTGQQSSNELAQHLSSQPAGVVDLNPGSITIDSPGVVSYRDGEPKVIYYYVGGELARAFYGIDD